MGTETTTGEALLEDWLARHRVDMTLTPCGLEQKWERQMHKWRITLHNAPRSSLTFDYWTGISHPRPTEADVLETLALDYTENVGFEVWAEDNGLDTDSRSAEAVYRGCVEQTSRLILFLGLPAVQELLTIMERR